VKKAKEIGERRALEKEMNELGTVDLDAPRATRGDRRRSSGAHAPRKSAETPKEVKKDESESEDDDDEEEEDVEKKPEAKKRRMVVPESSPAPSNGDGGNDQNDDEVRVLPTKRKRSPGKADTFY
jgi:hypothetical protein